MKWIRPTLKYTASLGEPDKQTMNSEISERWCTTPTSKLLGRLGYIKAHAGKRTCWAHQSMHLRHGLQTNRTPLSLQQIHTTEFTQKIKILNLVQIFIKHGLCQEFCRVKLQRQMKLNSFPLGVHRNRYFSFLLKEKHSINKHICNTYNTYNYNYTQLHIIAIHNI